MNNSAFLRLTLKTFAVLAVVAVLALPALVGMNAEAQLRQAELNLIKEGSLPISVKPIYFHRGWFSSDARSEYTMMLGTQSVRFNVNHHINQFVIPFYRWAKINHEVTHLDFGDTNIALPDQLSISTEKLFFGGISTHLSAGKISIGTDGAAKITLSNPSVNVTFSPDHARQFDMTIPALSLDGPANSGNLNMVNLAISGSDAANSASDTVWHQHSQAKLDSIELISHGVPTFAMHTMSMNADLKDRGANVDMIYQTNIQQSQFGDQSGVTANDINLNFSYLNLNKSALLKLEAAIKAMNVTQAGQMNVPGNPAEQARFQQAQLDSLLKQSAEIFSSSPSFSIDQFNMKTSFGDVDGKMEVHLNGDKFNSEQLTSDSVMPILKARTFGIASLKVARNIFMHTSASADKDAAMQLQFKENMLKMYVGQGYIVDDGKTLSVDASFGPQGVEVNGKHIM